MTQERKQQILVRTDLLTYLNNGSAVCSRIHAFNWLLQHAVKEPTEISKCGIRLCLNAGQLEASIVELSTKWKWHRRTVSSFLDELEKQEYIRRLSTNVSTVIELTCLNRCATEPITDCTAESSVVYTADYKLLPSVVHQDPPMQLPDDLRRLCKQVYDLFIETFPLLDKPGPYDDNIEKDIYYVFILGMRGDFDRLKQYFDRINADPMKNGTVAKETGMSAYKESFR